MGEPDTLKPLAIQHRHAPFILADDSLRKVCFQSAVPLLEFYFHPKCSYSRDLDYPYVSVCAGACTWPVDLVGPARGRGPWDTLKPLAIHSSIVTHHCILVDDSLAPQGAFQSVVPLLGEISLKFFTSPNIPTFVRVDYPCVHVCAGLVQNFTT
jgi:hypothetical protein